LAFVGAFGSFVGALVYYIKPIERAIALYFRLSKRNSTGPETPFDEDYFPVYKSEALFSSLLREERTIINGAFFMAVGLLLSFGLLGSIGLSYVYPWLQILTVVLIVAGAWEIYTLVTRKMSLVLFYYNNYNLSKNTPLMEKAIRAKDWIMADKIREKDPELDDPNVGYREYIPAYGLCPKCLKVRKGKYCTECGTMLNKRCKCGSELVENPEDGYLKYCRSCGSETNPEKSYPPEILQSPAKND